MASLNDSESRKAIYTPFVLYYNNDRTKGDSDMTKDMTKGNVTPQIVGFAVPLVLGNLFQLCYNAVDSMIVGRFVGTEALAAVGSSNPLMTLAILFINGMCMGASILMGMYYGAGDTRSMKRQISTTLLAGCAFSVVVSLISMIFAPGLLGLIQVKEEIIPLAALYLRTVFAGLIFTFIYNFYANTLRALGDSRTPVYFLMISSVINLLGDLFFVLVLDMGCEGCALATVISQALCSLLCGLYIRKRVPELCLGREWLVFDREQFGAIIRYGWASAMQQASVQLGKIGIQVIVNTMGISVTAAFAAVNRVDDFATVPQNSIAAAMTSFMAQNYGAGKKERIWKGFRSGMMVEIVYGIVVGMVCFWGAGGIMGLFTNDMEVAGLGISYLHLIACIYILPSVTNGVQGFFRGIGDLKVTLWSSIVNMGVRVLAALLLVYAVNMKIQALPAAYLLGWIGMMLFELPLLFRKWKERKQEKENQNL